MTPKQRRLLKNGWNDPPTENGTYLAFEEDGNGAFVPYNKEKGGWRSDALKYSLYYDRVIRDQTDVDEIIRHFFRAAQNLVETSEGLDVTFVRGKGVLVKDAINPNQSLTFVECGVEIYVSPEGRQLGCQLSGNVPAGEVTYKTFEFKATQPTE